MRVRDIKNYYYLKEIPKGILKEGIALEIAKCQYRHIGAH